MRIENLIHVRTRLPIQHPIFKIIDGERILTEVWGYYLSGGKVIEYDYNIRDGLDTHSEEVPLEDFSLWPLARISEGMADFFTKVNSLDLSRLAESL